MINAILEIAVEVGGRVDGRLEEKSRYRVPGEFAACGLKFINKIPDAVEVTRGHRGIEIKVKQFAVKPHLGGSVPSVEMFL